MEALAVKCTDINQNMETSPSFIGTKYKYLIIIIKIQIHTIVDKLK